MINVLELLYDQPGSVYGKDSTFVRTARIKNENLEMLNDTLSDEQKELMEAYSDANTKIEGMMNFDRFRYAFHLGALLMAEMMEGREELLK